MDIICHINGDSSSRKNTSHVIHFFGLLGCIRVNVLGKATPTNQEGKFNMPLSKLASGEQILGAHGAENQSVLDINEDLSTGATTKLPAEVEFRRKSNIVEYYFDYPHFSEIVNPEHFQKELSNGEKRFTRVVISLWLCFAILSTASNVLAYLVYSNQKSKQVIAGLATASVVLSTIAFIFFVAGLLWLFFDFVKEKLAINMIESHLKDLDHELVKKYKKLLIGEKQTTNEGTLDPESQKNKDIEEVLQFFLDRKKIPALFKFLTNGEELVQAGMAMVNKLLLAGVHPNDIVLDTNSMGGGVATEVLKRFEEKGIYLTLIHSNSYSSLKDVAKTFKGRLASLCLNILHKLFGLEFNSKETIKNTKCPVFIAGRKDDPVITKKAQLAGKLEDSIIPKKTFRINAILEHYSNKDCNIHVTNEEDLVWKDDKGSERYPKVMSDFIELAHYYLTSYKFNKKFDPEKYRESHFSKNLTEITLVPFGEVSNLVQCA